MRHLFLEVHRHQLDLAALLRLEFLESLEFRYMKENHNQHQLDLVLLVVRRDPLILVDRLDLVDQMNLEHLQIHLDRQVPYLL